ncbi:hypothetical protein BDA96_01G265100 [Sorghum bicolor]|uniref:Uncharacterized protein n=2 Tax=Sorghum bicolor TaxID=4558 RepID=A0A921UYJ5_SORBI|nr:hypothetical protein BDA96_01G265100 [Sorghum bicolor]OQU91795.1 hypothetical protein SORBI_3001G250150 [Sorghum bicolor]
MARKAEAEAGRRQHHHTVILWSSFHLFSGVSDECRQGICRIANADAAGSISYPCRCRGAERQRNDAVLCLCVSSEARSKRTRTQGGAFNSNQFQFMDVWLSEGLKPGRR